MERIAAEPIASVKRSITIMINSTDTTLLMLNFEAGGLGNEVKESQNHRSNKYSKARMVVYSTV